MVALFGVFLLAMTRLERKQTELQKLYEYRQAALKRNDLMWLTMNQNKIEALEKEIAEIKKYGAVLLRDALKAHGEDVKNLVYKHLLKITLAADYLNECTEQTKTALKKLGIDDFSLRYDVESLCKGSHKLADLVILPNQDLLTDMIVDNAEFIDTCDAAADKHLKDKLNL